MTELLNRDTQMFASLLAVMEWLQAKGYKISKSKLYRDRDDAKIEVEPDGKSVKLISVWEYAENYLGAVITDKEELKGLQKEKELKTIELKEQQIKKLDFARRREEGKVIPRDESDLRVVQTVTVMDTAYRQALDIAMVDVCHILTGNVKKVNAAKDFLDEQLDEMMNQMARTDSFTIKIKDL